MKNQLSLSEEGLAFLIAEEGVRLEAYLCPAGVWTIGVGHTGPEVKEGLVWAQTEAEEWLRKDLERFERCINDNTTVGLEQREYDALVSFSFNVGCGAYKGSTLLKLLNEDKREEAAAQFDRWNRGGGKVLPGLVARRGREKRLFLSS